SSREWSSGVCSSDLVHVPAGGAYLFPAAHQPFAFEAASLSGPPRPLVPRLNIELNPLDSRMFQAPAGQSFQCVLGNRAPAVLRCGPVSDAGSPVVGIAQPEADLAHGAICGGFCDGK